jgi:hypothetical protein
VIDEDCQKQQQPHQTTITTANKKINHQRRDRQQ